MSDFLTRLHQRVLVCDGAMGTQLQARALTSEDFDGREGCNEILCLTRPDVVRSIHEAYLAVGCDAIETNAFGANAVVLAEYDLADRVREINVAAARIAREAAAAYSSPDHPRYVLGNLGPGTKLPSLGHIDFDTLAACYREQVLGLLEGGVDALLIETCQDILQAKCALAGIDDATREFGHRPPVLVQVTMENTGTMLMGTEIGAALTAILGYDVQGFGLNCATGPERMDDHLRYLSEHCPLPLSVMPNAGLPQMIDGRAVFPLSPAELADWHERFVDHYGVALVGGCCGTTPEHLRQVVERLGARVPRERTVAFEPSLSSLYQRETIAQENSFLIVGERCNTTGSRRFRELLEAGDLDGMVQTAREQVAGGAQVLDVCVDYVGRDGVADMSAVIDRFATQVTVPLMIDSTEAEVIHAALKRLGGKATINSVNLESGLARPAAIFPLAKRYNAAVVALTIDEEGMARTAERKVAIARRLYELAVEEYGLAPGDLLFDCLTLPVSTGLAEDRRNAAETVEGVRRIKEACPGSFTILGVSNVSFGLRPAARQVLNSVFLHECQAAGLDAAIVHAGRIMPLHRIDEAPRQAALDLIYDRRRDGYDPLTTLVSLFEEAGEPRAAEQRAELPLEEELRRRIIDGDRVGLEALLDQALQRYDALTIVNDHLLAGMATVGELFGSGRMQLPFVLQSAEVMKAAVAYLEPHMPKVGGVRTKGTIVLATVRGDVHDIGKNLVDIILSNNGFRVINLGIKQPIDHIIDAALEHGADAIGLSGLLVKSTLVMRDNLEELNVRGLEYFPVVLGGAALTRAYVEQDLRALYRGEVHYAQDAFEGLEIVGRLCSPEARARRRKRQRSRYTGARPVVEATLPQPPPAVVRPAPGPRSDVAVDVPIPRPPFWGTKVVEDFEVRRLFEYVNPLALYSGQYRLRRRGGETREAWWRRIRVEAEPIVAAWQERIVAEELFRPRAVWGYFLCNADGEDLIVYRDDERHEWLRFTFPRQPDRRRLCIADYFRPLSSGELDVLACQVVTLGERIGPFERELFQGDRYSDYLYFHGLAVETTEALAEWVHQQVRAELGIGGEDAADVGGLFRGEYRGARYSFGYPACPALEDQAKLLELLQAERIGVTLSEEYQLVPEVSTSAVIAHHPEAAYFSVAAKEGTRRGDAKGAAVEG